MTKKQQLVVLLAAMTFMAACSKEKAVNKAEKMAEDIEQVQIQPIEIKEKQPEPVVEHTVVIPSKVEPKKASVTQSEQCHAATDSEIAALFDRWNAALKTGKADIVVANYAADSILLPTVSNKVRYSAAEKRDYFEHFLENSPVGEINERYIKIGCNSAVDAGVYTFHFKKTDSSITGRYSFTYEWNGDKWLITSHHSSAMPEKAKEQPEAGHAAPQQRVH